MDLEAIRFTPSFSFETNRAFSKQNALLDGDVRLYIRGLRNAKADRNAEAYRQLRLEDPKALPQDAPKKLLGYDTQIYVGTEAGGALKGNTVKSSDKSSQVAVPG